MRLVTFNILHGRSVIDGDVNVTRYADAITALAPDVLALQEVDREQPRSARADFTALAAEAMGAVDHRFTAALVGTADTTWTAATGDEQPTEAAYGVALLSRYPISAWQIVRLPAIPVATPLWLRGPRRMTLVTDEPRVCLAAAVSSPFGEMTVANVHLSFIPGWNSLQLRRARAGLRAMTQPVVLMGDLNMGAEKAAAITRYRPLARALTFPAAAPDRQLDHILVRGDFPPVSSVEARQLAFSDHRALVVDLG
jgi:endonuclease/exonuclease/phosphatase family metal-dependent hydrolase